MPIFLTRQSVPFHTVKRLITYPSYSVFFCGDDLLSHKVERVTDEVLGAYAISTDGEITEEHCPIGDNDLVDLYEVIDYCEGCGNLETECTCPGEDDDFMSPEWQAQNWN